MNIVIYARYSYQGQSETSIEGQLEICHRYAQEHNYHIVNEYIDRGISGRTDHRPAFQKMITDSIKHNFSAVLVYQLDRMGELVVVNADEQSHVAAAQESAGGRDLRE